LLLLLYSCSVLLRDNALYAGHAVPSSPVVVDDLPLILVDRYTYVQTPV